MQDTYKKLSEALKALPPVAASTLAIITSIRLQTAASGFVSELQQLAYALCGHGR